MLYGRRKRGGRLEFSIAENVYRRHAHFLVTRDRDSASKWFRKHRGPEVEANSRISRGRTVFDTGTGDYHVWLESPKNIGVLGHELVHIVVNILESRQIPIATDSDENMAYLYQFFMHHALKGLGHKGLSW